MLDLKIVKKLIYGFEEYERTRIDIRFSKTYDKLFKEFSEKIEPVILIDSIESFDLLDEVIFKIRELLRIKSSNLNKILKRSDASITKKDIEKILSFLVNIRLSFLEKVFNNERVLLKNRKESVKTQNEVKKLEVVLFEDETVKIIYKTYSKDIMRIIFKDQDIFSLFSELKQIVNFLVSLLGILEFNLVISDDSVVLYKRKEGDKCLVLRRKEDSSKIKEVFKIMVEVLKKFSLIEESSGEEVKDKGLFEIKEKKNMNIDENSAKDEKEIVVKNDYIKIDDSNRIDSLLNNVIKKKDKTSLDDLVFEKDKDKTFVDTRSKEKEIILEKDEPIEVIKSEKKSLENGVILEKRDSQKVVEDKTEDTLVEDIENVVYKDKNIVVLLNQNSKVFGELNIFNTKRIKLNELSENEFIYMVIFAKLFSILIFNELKAEGTNLIYDVEDDKIIILPRFKDDMAKAFLTWEPKLFSVEEFEQMKNELLETMHLDLKENVDKGGQSSNKSSNKEKKLEDDSKNDKVEYLLDKIRRLP